MTVDLQQEKELLFGRFDIFKIHFRREEKSIRVFGLDLGGINFGI